MGRIKPDLAGAFAKRVGGAAYYWKNGVNYVRSLSKGEYTSNTPQQAEVRAKFTSASQVAAYVKDIAKVGFPQRRRGLTAKNAWHSANKACFRKMEEGTEILFEDFQFSSGSLRPAEVTLAFDNESCVYTAANSKMPEESGCKSDDLVYLVLLDTENLFSRLVLIGKRGESGEVKFETSRLWSDSVMAYCFALSADGKIASKTLPVTIA